ncbi:MAG: tyrosine-type recombinase/integrase [Candidatus Dormibacterales bacterium]
MNLKDLVTDYTAHQRGRGLSPKTVELSRYALDTFTKWGAANQVTEPSDLDQRALDRYSAYLINEHEVHVGTGWRRLSRATCRTYVRTLSTFLSWCQAEGELAGKVRAQQPRAEKKLKEILTREEIDKLENAAELERDKIMIRLLADSGIRLGELLSLRPSDLTEVGRERYVKVRGKTGERLVPVLPAFFTRLRRYAGRGPRIFMTTRKSPRTGIYEPLRARSVENMLKYAATKAGIEKRVHPHVLRHSMVTEWLRQHKNPVSLQHILGWSSLAMLRDYEHLVVSDSYDAMLDFHRSA